MDAHNDADLCRGLGVHVLPVQRLWPESFIPQDTDVLQELFSVTPLGLLWPTQPVERSAVFAKPPTALAINSLRGQ